MGTRGSKAASPPEVVGGGLGSCCYWPGQTAVGGLGGAHLDWSSSGPTRHGGRRGMAPPWQWGPESLPQPPLPPDLAQGQFDVRELLPEGLIHVLLEVRRLHVLYHRGLQGRRQQVGELALHSPGGPPA